MQLNPIQIRLPKRQIITIDKKVKQKDYSSRSEAIRDYINKIETLETLRRFQELTFKENLNTKKLLTGLKNIRKQVYNETLNN
ncbi:MAG: ribbon-helix-helix domain-containing protein [Patescibacteria group bacterium]